MKKKSVYASKISKVKKYSTKKVLGKHRKKSKKSSVREQAVLYQENIKAKPYFEDRDRNVALFHGNCLDILSHIPDDSIDMIFADPPYNLSNGGFTCHAGKMVSVNKGSWDESNGLDKDLKFHIEWIKACRRVLKPNGTIWISGTYHSIYRCGYALERNGYHILNDIAWLKPNAAPNLSCRYFTASHETLL
ncbi:site-specific DNA-methyltransferase [bacterium]|nr:site-specific DNA-methyltransferase [bacterium]